MENGTSSPWLAGIQSLEASPRTHLGRKMGLRAELCLSRCTCHGRRESQDTHPWYQSPSLVLQLAKRHSCKVRPIILITEKAENLPFAELILLGPKWRNLCQGYPRAPKGHCGLEISASDPYKLHGLKKNYFTIFGVG